MAAASLPLARLLQLRVTIAWREAVAVVSAADMMAAAAASPITLERCHISSAGDVHLSGDGPGSGQALTSLQLLEALLDGQASPADLRALGAATDDVQAGPVSPGAVARPRLDLRWCLGANPRADVARLAARGLAAELAAERASHVDQPDRPGADRPLVRTRSRVPIERPRRSQAATVRGRRPIRRPLLSLAVVILSIVGIAATARLVVGGISWPAAMGGGASDGQPAASAQGMGEHASDGTGPTTDPEFHQQ